MIYLCIRSELCKYNELLCFFFFFKQKTAYEMRISDWSSDVCSSDLRPRRLSRGRLRLCDPVADAANHRASRPHRRRTAAYRAARFRQLSQFRALAGAARADVGRTDAGDPAAAGPIGTASGWERVCQYV